MLVCLCGHFSFDFSFVPSAAPTASMLPHQHACRHPARQITGTLDCPSSLPLLWLWLQEKETQSPSAHYVLGAGCPDGAFPSSSMLLGFILGQCRALPHWYSCCGHLLLPSGITSALQAQVFAWHPEVKQSTQACQTAGGRETIASRTPRGSPTEGYSLPPQHHCIQHMHGTEGTDPGWRRSVASCWPSSRWV